MNHLTRAGLAGAAIGALAWALVISIDASGQRWEASEHAKDLAAWHQAHPDASMPRDGFVHTPTVAEIDAMRSKRKGGQ